MNNLGLKKGTVKVLAHQDSWHKNFEHEKRLILSTNNRYIKSIEHIGSTSVAGMPAKPIIDINVGIDCFYNAKKVVKSLAEAGYEFRLEPRRYQWLFVKMDKDKETHYLKVIKYKGKYWNKHQDFKTTLTTNAKAFERYKKLKLKLVEVYSDNRKEYTKSKNELIKEILGKH